MKKKIRFDAKFGLKMTERFWKKKILKGWNVFLQFSNDLPLEKDVDPNSANLSPLQ